MDKQKKNDDKNNSLTKIVLATALLNLIKSIIDIISKLVD